MIPEYDFRCDTAHGTMCAVNIHDDCVFVYVQKRYLLEKLLGYAIVNSYFQKFFGENFVEQVWVMQDEVVFKLKKLTTYDEDKNVKTLLDEFSYDVEKFTESEIIKYFPYYFYHCKLDVHIHNWGLYKGILVLFDPVYRVPSITSVKEERAIIKTLFQNLVNSRVKVESKS